MKALESVRDNIRKRGTVVIPADFRLAYGLEEGADIVQEPTPEGILIRPAATVPIRLYSDKDKAAFMLNNACSPEEYAEARREVVAMGLDPDQIKHRPVK